MLPARSKVAKRESQQNPRKLLHHRRAMPATHAREDLQPTHAYKYAESFRSELSDAA